jgi:hypothetical protein
MDLTVAICLLWVPSHVEEPIPTHEQLNAIVPALTQLAIEMELAGDNEVIPACPALYPATMAALRFARESNLPSPRRDGWRMPNEAWSLDQWRMAKAHLAHLNRRYDLEEPLRDRYLGSDWQEAQRHVAIWKTAVDYHASRWSLLQKRWEMKRYIELVGEEDFYSLRLPQAHPYDK